MQPYLDVMFAVLALAAVAGAWAAGSIPARLPAKPHRRTLLVAGGVTLLFGIAASPKAFAHDGLIHGESGTCIFEGEPAPCEQFISPCFKGVEYFYFPIQGVMRSTDDRVVEIDA